MATTKEALTATISRGDDWICVSDDSQSIEAIRELKIQLEDSRRMVGDFKAVASNLQKNFNELTTELVRLQKVEQEAKDLKNTVDSLQKSCDDPKTKVALTAAKSDAQAKASHHVAHEYSNAVITKIPKLHIDDPLGNPSDFINCYMRIQPALNAIAWLEEVDQTNFVADFIEHACGGPHGSCGPICEKDCFYFKLGQKLNKFSTEEGFTSINEMLQYISERFYRVSFRSSKALH